MTKQSRRDKPRAGPQTALSIILFGFGAFLLIAAGAIWFLSNPPRNLSAPAVGGPFQLINGDGRPVTEADFRGKYMLIYFGYTFCPDVCPATLQNVAGALDQLGPESDAIQPIFITVDPERDTVPVIKQYTAAFSPHLIGLTGTVDQLKKVEITYHIYVQKRPAENENSTYSVDHSSILYLMGTDGLFVAALRADETSQDIASDLKRYTSDRN